ncbi:unnamed protein product [Peronospora destructor]|uniref:Cytochrome b5 heme-binding domain-containing protein n=1 Tax=Peronospora destructor TaxID=86335 RepID=A0AAV0VCG2_9STRA|nr:unnamed protein product [Peronospora destructor]
MKSSRSSATVSTGNRVAQFIVIVAIFSVVYQLFIKSATVISLSIASLLSVGYDKGKESHRFTSSEITGILLFLGLFGLLQHKNKQEKKANIEAEQRQIVKIVQSSKIRAWNHNAGNAAETLWRHVFQRDFDDAGDKFANVFLIKCWRQFYFRHHLSRAVELARLFKITHGRKCVAIKGQVYDVTDFLELHPGGPHVIGDAVGTDATVVWDQFQHSNEAKRSMEQFLVWDKVLARPESELALFSIMF